METKKEQTSKIESTSLEDFNWEDTDNMTFFGLDSSGVEVTSKSPSASPPAAPKGEKGKEEEGKEGEEEEKKGKKEEEEEEEENITFFEQSEGDDEDEDKLKEPAPKEDLYTSMAGKLKDNGFFLNVELPKDRNITEEEFFDFNDQEHEARVDEALEDLMTGLDEDAVAFLKFKKEGGSTKKFFDIFNRTLSAPTGDLKDEAYQEKVVKYYYENIEDMDAEDITDKIEWLKESGKLSKYAEKFDIKVKGMLEEDLADEKEALKEQAKTRETKAKNFVANIEKVLGETTEIGNFVFDKKLKDALRPFITKATVKTGTNSYATGMQVKMQETLKDPKKLLLLARLLYKDFDTTDVLEMGKTKLTKEIKTNLNRTSPNPTNVGGNRGDKKRSLADYDFD